MLDNSMRGGQIFLHQILMFNQLFGKAFSTGILIASILTYYMLAESMTKLDVPAGVTFVKAHLINFTYGSVPFLGGKGSKSYPKIDAIDKHGLYAKGVKVRKIIESPKFKREASNILLFAIRALMCLIASTIGPMVAKEVVTLLQGDITDAFDSSIKHYNNKLKELSSCVGEITQGILTLKTSSMKRVIFHLGALLLVSILSSSFVSYFMMKQFPPRVSVDASGNISVKDSQVHWSSEKVLHLLLVKSV